MCVRFGWVEGPRERARRLVRPWDHSREGTTPKAETPDVPACIVTCARAGCHPAWALVGIAASLGVPAASADGGDGSEACLAPLRGCMTASGVTSLPPWGPGTRTGSRTRRSRGSRASRPNGIHAGRAPPGAAGIRGWGLRLLTRRKISTASTLRHPRSRAPGKERSVAAHRPQSTAVSEAASVLGRSAA